MPVGIVFIGADGTTTEALRQKSGPVTRMTFYSSAIVPVRPAKASRRYRSMGLSEMFKRKDEGLCPFCGREVNMDDFRDDLSRHEFELSGLCQMCQDYFFKEE